MATITLPPSLQHLASSVVSATPSRIETEHHVIHLTPRISATKLAEYVVADPSRQRTIVKQSKTAKKAITIPYSRVRNALPGSLLDGILSPEFLRQRAIDAEGSGFSSTWQKNDNTRSAAALNKLAEIAPQINCRGASQIHRPQSGWRPLSISGVRVSVQPELVFSLLNTGVTKLGAVILSTGQRKSLSLAKSADENCVGDYLTTLLIQMLTENLASVGNPLHTRCYAVDIFRGHHYTALKAHKNLKKHMEAACEMIALRWDSTPVDVDADDEADLVF